MPKAQAAHETEISARGDNHSLQGRSRVVRARGAGRWIAGCVRVRRRSRLLRVRHRTLAHPMAVRWRSIRPSLKGTAGMVSLCRKCHHGGPGRAGNGEEPGASTAYGFITSASWCRARLLLVTAVSANAISFAQSTLNTAHTVTISRSSRAVTTSIFRLPACASSA